MQVCQPSQLKNLSRASHTLCRNAINNSESEAAPGRGWMPLGGGGGGGGEVGVPDRKNAFRAHAFFVLNQAVRFSLRERSELQRLGKVSPQARSFDGGPLSPKSTYM